MKKHESIITDDWEYCFLCKVKGKERRADHEHHCICGMSNRKLSDKYHLVVPLCWECHDNIHQKNEDRRYLEVLAQERFEQVYPEENFLKIFGRNYKYKLEGL